MPDMSEFVDSEDEMNERADNQRKVIAEGGEWIDYTLKKHKQDPNECFCEGDHCEWDPDKGTKGIRFVEMHGRNVSCRTASEARDGHED